MQAAGMLCGTRTIYLLVFLISLIGYAHSFPLQLLPSIPGYIPVYIRHGDQPLEEINPALAEAFHEGPSLSKSMRLDDIPVPKDLNVEEEETFTAKLNKSNPVRDVRRNKSKDKEANKPTEKIPEAKTPKLLTIYALPDDRDRSRGNQHRRDKSRRRSVKKSDDTKEPVFKLGPLPEGQEPVLGKLAIQVEKEENKPNDLHDSISKHPRKSSHRSNDVQKFGPPLKVDFNIENEPPSINKSGLFKDQGTHSSSIADEEVPVKEQRPADVLANVHKLSPIDLPEASTLKQSISTEGSVDCRQKDKTKDLAERNGEQKGCVCS